MKIAGYHNLKVGDILECPDCGLFLEVKEECKEFNDNSFRCDDDCDFLWFETLLIKK